MKVASRWTIANIASDDALILPHCANPPGWNFRERQVRTMDQGRQGRDQVDTAVVQDVRGQRRAAPASCARLQSWQLSPHACNTGADQGLVADELEGEADQDRREGGEPRTLRRLPNGGGRHPTTNVPGDSAADRGTTAATTTRASMKRLIVTRSSAIDRRNASSNLLLPEQPANRSTFLRTLSPANAGLSLRPSTHRWVRGNSCRLSDASSMTNVRAGTPVLWGAPRIHGELL